MTKEYNGFTWTDNYSHYLDKKTGRWVAASTASRTGGQTQTQTKENTTTQYNGNTWTPDGTSYLDKTKNKWVKAPVKWTTASSSSPYSSYTPQPQGQTLGYSTAPNMTNSMYSMFQQAPNPTAAALTRKQLVEENLQTPGQPAKPYVPLSQAFIAAGSQSFLFGSFVEAYHKLFRGEV